MKSLEEILQYNEKFVEEKRYEEYETENSRIKNGNYLLYGYSSC